MHNINFAMADLTKTLISNCDLMYSVFNETNLSDLDFTKAQNFSIDSSINIVRKAKFLIHDLPSLLHKFDLLIE